MEKTKISVTFLHYVSNSTPVHLVTTSSYIECEAIHWTSDIVFFLKHLPFLSLASISIIRSWNSQLINELPNLLINFGIHIWSETRVTSDRVRFSQRLTTRYQTTWELNFWRLRYRINASPFNGLTHFYWIQNRCLWKIRWQTHLEPMMLTYKQIETERIFKLQETCLSLTNFYP